MTTPTLLRLAFDSGWSHGGRHGDPGDGRLRFDTPKIAQATNLCINARDAQDALLNELIPTWRIGDVVVIERPGAEGNRVVVWIIGPIVHMGPFYRVPIIVRTVNGAFAAHDALVLHHHRNITDVDDQVAAAVVQPAKPNSATELLAPAEFGQQPALPSAPAIASALTPIAPLALMAIAAENDAKSAAYAPIAPISPDAIASEVEKLRADNSALHDILSGLLSDNTELYTVEHD